MNWPFTKVFIKFCLILLLTSCGSDESDITSTPITESDTDVISTPTVALKADVNDDGFVNNLDILVVGACIEKPPEDTCASSDINNDGKIDQIDVDLITPLLTVTLFASVADADINNDGIVNIVDITIIANCIGQDPSAVNACAAADVDGDGNIDSTDVDDVAANFGDTDFTAGPDPDINQDGVVNIVDVSIIGNCVGQDPAIVSACTLADVDGNGSIDLSDIEYVKTNFGNCLATTACVGDCFPNGVAAGDVDQSSVVLWARASFTGTVRFEIGKKDEAFTEVRDVCVSDSNVPAKVVIEEIAPRNEVPLPRLPRQLFVCCLSGLRTTGGIQYAS